MYPFLKNKYDKKDINCRNTVYVVYIYENYKFYERSYNNIYEINIIHGYINYKQIGINILHDIEIIDKILISKLKKELYHTVK
jgi:hypothetical protein